MEPLRFSLMLLLVTFGAYAEFRAEEYLHLPNSDRNNITTGRPLPCAQIENAGSSQRINGSLHVPAGTFENLEFDNDSLFHEYRHSVLDYDRKGVSSEESAAR